MLRFAADENLNYNIVRGLLRRKSDLNIIRIQDVGLSGKDDATVLEWAAQKNRILMVESESSLRPVGPTPRRERKGHGA